MKKRSPYAIDAGIVVAASAGQPKQRKRLKEQQVDAQALEWFASIQKEWRGETPVAVEKQVAAANVKDTVVVPRPIPNKQPEPQRKRVISSTKVI